MFKIKKWLKQNGYSLTASRGLTDCVIYEDKVVQINSKNDKNSQLCTALHECGHVLVRIRRERNPERRITGLSLDEYENEIIRFAKGSKRKVISILTEEIEAWERGWKLKNRLRIKLKAQTFENVRIKALMSYVYWSANQKQKNRRARDSSR